MNIVTVPVQTIAKSKSLPVTLKSEEAGSQSFPYVMTEYQKSAETEFTKKTPEIAEAVQVRAEEDDTKEDVVAFLSFVPGMIEIEKGKNNRPSNLPITRHSTGFPLPANTLPQSLQQSGHIGTIKTTQLENAAAVTENIGPSEIKSIMDTVVSEALLGSDTATDFLQFGVVKSLGEFNSTTFQPMNSRGIINLSDTANWAKNLSAEILALKSEQGDLQLRINPRHLGGLSISILAGETGDLLMIRADTIAAHNFIQSAQAQLEMELRMSGNRFARIDITAQEAGDFSAADYPASDGGKPHSQPPDSKHGVNHTSDLIGESKIEQSPKPKKGLFA